MTALLWLGLGLLCGVAISTIRTMDVHKENERLRTTLSNVRAQIQRGNLRGAVSLVERALEDECAA